jgi:hypothetical protein
MRACAAVTASLALGLAVCACGSSNSSTTSSSAGVGAAGSAKTSDQLTEARIQASNCIRAQGINIPDLIPGGGAIIKALQVIQSYPQVKVQAAEKACQSQIRKAFPNLAALTPQQISQRRQQAVDFAQCMRAHGINYPDPTTAASNPAGFLTTLKSLASTPAYKADAPACEKQALKQSGA